MSLVRFADVPRLAAEGPVLYSIWKIRHGYPLYESPFVPFFPVTLYNFLSYETYAAALRLFRVPDALTPLAARGVTAAFAAAGLVLQYLAARTLLANTARADRLLPALLAILAWCGAVLPGGWTMAIRPDVGAVALDLLGVWLVLQVLRGGSQPRLLLAGAAFFAAWAFKQSHLVVCATTVAYLVIWRRSWRGAILVAAPFAAGVAATLAIGGEVYRANTIAAPALSPLLPLYAWFGARTIAIPEALFWMTAIVAAGVLLRSAGDMPGESERRFGLDLVYPLLLTAATAVAAALMLAKAGSAINHAIELKVCAALLAAGVLAAPRRRAYGQHAAACFATIVMLASHGSRLLAERDRLAAGIRGTDSAIASRRSTASTIASLPRPLYAEDELYALPWIANGNQYPAVIPDYQVYHASKDAGLLRDSIEAMTARRAFASLALEDTSPLVPLARQAGYEIVATVPQFLDRPVVILRRPSGAGTR